MKEISQRLKAKNLKQKVSSSKFQVLLNFFKQKFLLIIFIGCIGFVGLIVFYKLFISKPTYIYAKVKVGQGMWWASTQRPSLWFVKAIQEAKEQKDLTGKPLVTMMGVSYYPTYLSGQYDVYVTVKLKVSLVGKKETYSFNREAIGVSTPIDLEFPNVQFSGTIIALSEKPFADILVKKTIYLTKRIPFPWEYEQIEVGDLQTDGNQTVFKIIEKSYADEANTAILQQGFLLNSSINLFSVKAQILVKEVGEQYIFGEENIIAPGKFLMGVATKNFTFSDYYITKIE